MRKPIIAGNWKMHNTVEESLKLAGGIKKDVSGIDNVDIVLCPTFTSLAEVNDSVKGTNVAVGGQNVYWEAKGAFTGEISPNMLKAVGCKFVIIGHSERRSFFGETNETVNKKIKSSLKESLTPIVCVGETLEERESGKTFQVVSDHVVNGLLGLTGEEVKKLVIAYEPVWAIGTGKTATAGEAEEVHKYIRGILKDKFGEEVSESVRIEYGGSVKPGNIEELISQPDIDGALVGGASLKADSFVEIIKKSSKRVKEK